MHEYTLIVEMLKIAYNSIYCHPLPEGHRFPMIKYELIPEQLLYEGTCTSENFFDPQENFSQNELEKYILKAHSENYYNDLLQLQISPQMQRKIGFPLTKELVQRELLIVSGTVECCAYALQNGISMNVAGGTHHAYPNHGEGFCLLNDVAVAAHYLLETHQCKRILIIDLDVHQGNGTAVIFQNEPRVFTFSMHGAANYPLRKEQSDLDIHLPTKTTDTEYLGILKNTLPRLLKEVKPDFIFYISGVDILETDKLGHLSVTKEGCKERDVVVLEAAKEHQLPVVITMGGGYSARISDIIETHCATFRVAANLFPYYSSTK